MQKQHYIHRDLSWLSFNERVLQEAEDATNPLYERLKFLAIFSSNLDEFYRVRVSELRQFKKLQKDIRLKLHEKPKKIISDIQKRVDVMQDRFGKVFRDDILIKLEKENIFLIQKEEFSPEQIAFAKTFYKENVEKHIEVHYLKDDTDLTVLKNKGLFLFLDIENEDVLITIPTDHVSRFVVFPKNNNTFSVTFLEEIIRVNQSEIHDKYSDCEAYSVKITRDAELYFDEYDGELIELIKENLSQREGGIPTRVLYNSEMPKALRNRLRKQLKLNKTDLMAGGKFHNFSDFFGFPSPKNNNTLFYNDQNPLTHPVLEDQSSLIEVIKQQDVLLSFPYQKYDYVTQIILEAAVSKEIHTINITLYRVSKDSVISNALLKCLENGKKVTVFIEAKARFDEANNIYWGEKLKQKGANVLYSMPKLKVHSKIFLLEADTYNIAYVGTGNFNEKSAKIYTDFGLITSNKDIASDLKQVFTFLYTPKTNCPNPSAIWVSPFTTRNSIYQKIDREIIYARQGKKASIFFKMNSLEDEAIINKLYEASKEGVKIKLIVRGIFRLKSNVLGLSENIEAISIVGRFLEHARIYSFYNDGDEELYIASADCMSRNLDKRIEVAVPIKDVSIKTILKKCLDLQWSDDTKSRILDAEQTNQYALKNKGLINSQEAFYEFLKNDN